jgi:hypothetical protein
MTYEFVEHVNLDGKYCTDIWLSSKGRYQSVLTNVLLDVTFETYEGIKAAIEDINKEVTKDEK